MNQPMDICMFISDQHAWQVQGYAGDPVIRTPHLDRIAAAGTAMMNAYTPCPLCVPARMAMLSGQYAGRIRVMDNKTALSSNRATFVHCLNASGYDTTLCGRMHFVGPDQRHGFSQRIAGDITQAYHNRPATISAERGVHDKTPQGGPSSLSIIGGGNSPTLEFDRYVTGHALEYLAGTYEKPQFLCVGTYGPHHPYVAPPELYRYYHDKVTIPQKTFSYPLHPAVEQTALRDTDPEVVQAVRAAYYGMVEFEDEQVGIVYDAFQTYLKRNGRQGIFLYVSDHGDHIGYRGCYGKTTFYDPSAHIPMIFAGDGIRAGQMLHGAVSLLDVGPTLCELAGAVLPPETDGHSLLPQLRNGVDDVDRMVVSEVNGGFSNMPKMLYGKMCKWRNYKLIHYSGYDEDDVLYDLASDPREATNIISAYPEIAAHMRQAMDELCDICVDELQKEIKKDRESIRILSQCDFDNETDRWHATEAAREYPAEMVSSKLTVEMWKEQLRERQKNT